ncbi:hypothetical protein QE152_g34012 [Popillia japonica]|uniref:Endonuclease/exonuclease/phosphatase domain-containing protein n=1 Tax=Popillia japonica TaxID=7064 RepID=A0AAW1IVM0_POPJA
MSTENVSDNTKKAQKRSKPDHDISLEEKNHFQRSKLTPRSPVKVRVPKEIRSILMELKKEFKEDLAEIKKEIRTEITQMKEEVNNLKVEFRRNNEEIERVKEEITQIRKEWEDEKQNLMQKLRSSDEKYEKMKRNLIRNNIIITGLKVDATDEKIMKEAIEGMIETHLGIKVNTKKVYKIDKKRCVAELADRDEKIKILKVKSKLKGKDIYIDSELTFEERSMQRKIRDKAREERNRGAIVRETLNNRLEEIKIRGTKKEVGKGLNNDGQQTEKPQRKASDGKLCNIGTWNVRGTYGEGALQNLAAIMKKYEIDILAVQETKQKGQEIITLDGYTLFNSGGENRCLGVGFLLRNEFKYKVVDFEPIGERVCRLRLRGKYWKISLLNVHAPTEDKDLIVKSEFYEELEKVLEKVPKFELPKCQNRKRRRAQESNRW